MTSTVLYIGSFVNDEIREMYGIEQYSIAGNNKTKNIVKSLQRDGKSVLLLSPLFANKTNFSYYSGKRIYDEELDAEIQVPPRIGIKGLNFATVFLASILYALVISRKEKTNFTIFYNYRLQRMIPAFVASYSSTLILQYEDGHLYSSESYEENSLLIRALRALERRVKIIVDKRVQGAICTNTHLARISPTENTAIVRGVPSVGQPEEMPDPRAESDDVIVMFAGKLDGVRGIDTFLKATKQIDRENVQFWISGYGARLDEIEENVVALNDDRVRFFGTLPWDEYKQRLVDSDILVNFQDPTVPESKFVFPSKLLDFMLASSVIISTDISDISVCFDDKVVITDHGEEIETLRDVITGLNENPTMYNDQVAQAETWVKTQTEKTIANKIERVIEAASA